MLPLVLPVLLFLHLVQQQTPSPADLTCGVRDAKTATLRSSAGFAGTLKMHSEDDHGKNTHLCQADYSLQITRPDGSADAPFDKWGSDDDWNRPIQLRIDGFSRDGRHVFVFIAEGYHHDSIQLTDYDMSSGDSKDVFLDRHFTARLSRACVATLHIAGVSPAGQMLLGSNRSGGCIHAEIWKLSPIKYTSTGAAMTPESPKRVSYSTGIVTLEPGIPVQP